MDYGHHLLVESIATPQGPRHRTICSLGSLAPAPEAQWRGLAQKLSSALGGQTTFLPDPAVAAGAARARPPPGRPRPTPARRGRAGGRRPATGGAAGPR